MLSTFRRFLKRSKDREAPANTPSPTSLQNAFQESAFNAIHSRPRMTAAVNRLRRQHKELQRQLRQLPSPRPITRRAKLRDALQRALLEASVSSAVQIQRVTSSMANPPRPQETSAPLWARLSDDSPQVDPSDGGPGNGPLSSSPALLVADSSTSAANEPAAILRQAASAHRIRRLRAWSQHHQTPSPPLMATLGPEPVSHSPGSVQVSLRQQKAWGILATLQLERLSSAPTSSSPGQPEAPDADVSKMFPRRRTEPPNSREGFISLGSVARNHSEDSLEQGKLDPVDGTHSAKGAQGTRKLGRPLLGLPLGFMAPGRSVTMFKD